MKEKYTSVVHLGLRAGWCVFLPVWLAAWEARSDTVLPAGSSQAEDHATTIATAADGPASRERFGTSAMTTSGGTVGLAGMSAADVGHEGHLRLGLGAEFFHSSNFLVSAPGSSGDRDTRLRGGISASGSPGRFLELFGAVTGSANRNRRICGTGSTSDTCRSEAGRADPEVIRTSAALSFGGKTAAHFGERFSAGAELGARLLPSVSGVLFDGDATSAWLTALSSLDLGGPAAAPLRMHASAGFFLDNSSKLRESASDTASSRLVSAFAYGTGKPRLQGALGFEAPLRDRWFGQLVRPAVAYHVDVVTADADPVLVIDRRSNRDRHWLTFGIDVQTRRGLTVSAGFELGLRRSSFAYGPPIAPQNFLLAIGQAIDLSEPKVVTQVVERQIKVPVPVATREGFVRGRVLGPRGPIEGALVGVPGQSRVATNADGSFKTAALASGPVALHVEAPNFQAADQPAVVVAGRESPIEVTLAPVSRSITGHVSDPQGRPALARLIVLPTDPGSTPIEATADQSGVLQLTLAAGIYQGYVTSERFLGRPVTVRADADGLSSFDLTLQPRPAKPRVILEGNVARFSRPIRFADSPAASDGVPAASPAARLAPDASGLLDELVDLVAPRPARSKLRIRAHWDAGVGEAEAQRLTEAQAASVVAYLSRAGIPRERIEATGAGATEPLEGQPRGKHRRVEITIVD